MVLAGNSIGIGIGVDNVIDIGIDVIGWQTQWLRHRTGGHYRAPLGPAHFGQCSTVWRNTLSQTNATSVTMHPSMQAL